MKFLLALMASIFALKSAAQDFHLNVFAGTLNYQGDLQDKRFTFSQSHLAAGLGVSYDLTDQFSIRSAVGFGKLSADDKYGRNYLRNLNFTSNISEINLGLEYYITPLADHSLTPYVFGGIGIYHYDPYTTDTSGTKYFLKPLSTEGEGFIDGKKNYALTQLCVPFGAGVKLSLTDNVNVGLELGLRKLFTDYLDDVSTTYVDESLLLANRGAKGVELAFRGGELKNGSSYPAGGTTRGGAKNKDWYYLTAFTISYRLGAINNGVIKNGKRHSKYGCPANVN